MTQAELKAKPGDTVLVIRYLPDFQSNVAFHGQHNKAIPWKQFRGRFVKVNTVTGLSSIIDISDSPDLTSAQKRMTSTGKISVSNQYIDAVLPEAEIVKSPMAAAQHKGGQARQAHRDNGKRERAVIASLAKGYFLQGYSTAQAAKIMGKRLETIHKAIAEAEMIEPRRRGARLIRKEGVIAYYNTVGEAAKKLQVSELKLRNNGSLEVRDGRVETGSWIEWMGKVREYLPDSKRFAASNK